MTVSPQPDPPSARKPLFEASTQFRNWRFSPEQLHHTRTNLNEAAVAVIRNSFEVYEPGSSANVAFLNAEEEYLLVQLYLSKIPQLCAHFRFPEEVEATAMTYLKRFYLKNTVMDWHPKNVMLTALFLATKTTNNPISLDGYAAKIPKTAPSDVLELEFLVAQSLSFEFAVWHAHTALWGIWLDLESLSPKPDKPQEVYTNALTHVASSRLTDAELVYTPSQIALACMHLASPSLATLWYRSKHPTAIDVTIDAPLPHPIPAVEALISSRGRAPPVEAVREVDRRLKLCKNPEKVEGSKAYLAKQAELEKKAEIKRKKKAASVRIAMEEGDPFGEPLEKLTPAAGADDDDDDDD